jgi:hypothetical protein
VSARSACHHFNNQWHSHVGTYFVMAAIPHGRGPSVCDSVTHGVLCVTRSWHWHDSLQEKSTLGAIEYGKERARNELNLGDAIGLP